jgi:hypothetical protein
MIVDKYGNYVRKFMWQLCGWNRADISLTVHSRAICQLSNKSQLYPTHTVVT